MPHTYQIIDDDDFDPQDDLRPEYDFASLRKTDQTSLESFESKVQAIREAVMRSAIPAEPEAGRRELQARL